MTGFTIRGLQNTSNSINIEDYNYAFEKDKILKLSPSFNLCWHSPPTKSQVNNVFQCQVETCQSSYIECVWKTPFYKSGHYWWCWGTEVFEEVSLFSQWSVCFIRSWTGWDRPCEASDLPEAGHFIHLHKGCSRTKLEAELMQLLESGCIEPSSSPYTSRWVFVYKKDGGLRTCVDCREINKDTISDWYPNTIPCIDDLIDMVWQCKGKFITTLDLMKGYYQIRMEKKLRAKTAITCHLS